MWIQRENIQPQISAAKVKAGTFGYSQNRLDGFSLVLTSSLSCAFLSSPFPYISLISVPSHSCPK